MEEYIPDDSELIEVQPKPKKTRKARISVGDGNYPDGYLKEKAKEIIGEKEHYTAAEYLRVIEKLKESGENELSKVSGTNE